MFGLRLRARADADQTSLPCFLLSTSEHRCATSHLTVKHFKLNIFENNLEQTYDLSHGDNLVYQTLFLDVIM